MKIWILCTWLLSENGAEEGVTLEKINPSQKNVGGTIKNLYPLNNIKHCKQVIDVGVNIAMNLLDK